MNKSEPFSIKSAIIGALIASIPTIIISCINNWDEDKRIVTETKVARQNIEIERSRKEIEEFIHNYKEYEQQTNVIFKNLTKSKAITAEDFLAPDLNSKSAYLKDEEVDKRISNLANMVASLQNNYFELTTIHRITIPEDVIASVTGVYLIIKLWSQLENEKHPSFPIQNLTVPVPCWYPENNLLIPPKEPWKIRDECMQKLDMQINVLTDIRKRIIDGEF